VYAPLRLRPAHRLDADTSGVVVLSKTRDVARCLQPQFETGRVEKKYVAKLHGTPNEEIFECSKPLADAPGPDGVRLPDENGKPALTRFCLLQKHDDGTSLVEAIPITGRTNQIRAHLWSLGTPIVGDPIYLRDDDLGVAKSLAVGDPPLCLHAASLAFDHPQTGERMTFKATRPIWM
jgi:RluA family pseudouridine synthase